jgi:hypothetical protein
LNDELGKIGQMLSVIKKSCPKAKKINPGRLGKKSQPDNGLNFEPLQKIIEYLDSVFDFSKKVTARIGELSNENKLLKEQILGLNFFKTYAAAAGAAGAALKDHPTQGRDQTDEATSFSRPLEIKQITSKIDKLEQESLANVLSLQGTSISEMITSSFTVDGSVDSTSSIERPSSTRDASAPAGAQPGPHKRAPPQAALLKQAVHNVLSPIVPQLSIGDLSVISVQGRDRKHLKVTCSSREVKFHILSSFRHNKPENLFANEYLTKHRAQLLYKLRCLRRRFDDLGSVYCSNGSIYYKIRNLNTDVLVTDVSDVNKLEVKLLNAAGNK